MLAECGPAVPVAEEAAPLQLRHDESHHVLVGTRHVGGGDDKTVTGVAVEPLFHLIGYVGRGADEARTLKKGGSMTGQIGEGDGVASDVLTQVLDQAPDAGHRSDQLVRDGRIELQPREVVVHAAPRGGSATQ